MTKEEALKALDEAVANRDKAKEALKAAENKVSEARASYIKAAKE
jgi:hypothetical protein